MTNKTEIYNISSNTWSEADDYPYHDWYVLSNLNMPQMIKKISIDGFATVTTSQGALIIGGRTCSGGIDIVIVACYNNAGWSRLDNLQAARRGFRAINNGKKIYLIGGVGTQ